MKLYFAPGACLSSLLISRGLSRCSALTAGKHKGSYWSDDPGLMFIQVSERSDLMGTQHKPSRYGSSRFRFKCRQLALARAVK